VVRLLDARLSIEIIAAVLHISPGAVRRHASIAYWKIVAGTRRGAVAPEDGTSCER
jgi:hypothetical protein